VEHEHKRVRRAARRGYRETGCHFDDRPFRETLRLERLRTGEALYKIAVPQARNGAPKKTLFILEPTAMTFLPRIRARKGRRRNTQ